MDDLLNDFLTETTESLCELDLALVRLERTPDDAATLALIFRQVHTVKGTCGFLGLARLEMVAHAAENVLVRLRDRQLPATPTVIGTVLGAVDRIKAIVAGIAESGREPAGDDAALVAALAAIAEGGAPPPAEAEAPPPAPPAAPPTPATPESATATPAAAATQTIRVAVDVLEELMALVGELVLTRNQLLQLVRGQDDSALSVPLQRLSQITSDLQEGVMKTRMQPIGGAWNKLPRLVRDLGHELAKRIELVMHGAETELDRQVLELIKDPLTHMVRNAADHGLEPPEERRAAGKGESGRITLRAFQEGGHVVIEIADDGRGLPAEKIRAKALARGLATEAELAAMSESQVLHFIFRPGFSTAAAVTAVSGRGVGMDVVRSNIERIGGSIELASVPGQGSRFIIRIPLTLAIAAALIVESAGARFAIPQLSVVELVHVGGGQDGADGRIERIGTTPVLRLRERLLPLVSLRALLRLDDDAGDAPAAPYVVVTQAGAALLGIMVDAVFDTEEIVVKPVAPILRHVSLFGGNTILGDGSVIMILDPNGVARAGGLQAEGHGGDAASAGAAEPVAKDAARTALLLFRAGDAAPKAVPLGAVARIERIAAARIERSAEMLVTQYRGRLMPLVPLAAAPDGAEAQADATVLVFAPGNGDGEAAGFGLVVDEILDVAEEDVHVELASGRPGILGTAIVAGHATDLVDVAHWRRQIARALAGAVAMEAA